MRQVARGQDYDTERFSPALGLLGLVQRVKGGGAEADVCASRPSSAKRVEALASKLLTSAKRVEALARLSCACASMAVASLAGCSAAPPPPPRCRRRRPDGFSAESSRSSVVEAYRRAEVHSALRCRRRRPDGAAAVLVAVRRSSRGELKEALGSLDALAAAPAVSRAEASEAVGGMIERLQALKRKVATAREEEERHAQGTSEAR